MSPEPPSQTISKLIARTRLRVDTQNLRVTDVVGTAQHKAEVTLLLLLQDILFELEESRRLVRQFEGGRQPDV